MKKIFTLSILALFILTLSPSYGSLSIQKPTKTSKDLKQAKKLDQQKHQEAASEVQSKKDIELKEHSVNKEKKVRSLSTDKNIHQIIKKRNNP